MSGPLLANEPWLTCAETRAVFDALEADGKAARVVGGCVRDALIGRPITDIDIATPERPERIMALLEAADIRTIPTGLSHGTVTALIGKKTFEITTLRQDVETDGRHATVAWTEDWGIDAARRDFTFNALSATRDGTVYDPFDGIADLKHGRVRFVGNAAERIIEDRLRVLRFFRFFALFGKGAPDTDALTACRAAAGDLGALAKERIRVEILKLLGADDPMAALNAMIETGVWAALIPVAPDMSRLRRVIDLENNTAFGLSPNPVRRLGVVSVHTLEDAETVAAALKLSNADSDRVLKMASGDSLDDLQTALYQDGIVAVQDRAALTWAESGDALQKWTSVFETMRDYQRPTFPIGGTDVLNLGVSAGPRVGQLLTATETWWITQDFQPDRDGCLRHLIKVTQTKTN